MRTAALALLLAACLVHLVPAGAQLKPAELPRLMTARSVMSLPAAAPAETLRYGEGDSQVVELFLPRGMEGGDPLPVIVMIHGGCWQQSVAGRELVRPAAGAFVERGFAVWSVGYRRIDEAGGGYPGTFADVGRAVDLLRDEAAARNLDLSRIVFWGHSAGAHLALWAASRHRLPADSPLRTDNPLRPLGVVSVGGLTSLKDWEGHIRLVCGDDTVPRLAPGDGPARFADTSPDELLPSGVPMVLLHGVYDRIAPPAMGLSHAEAARRAGDRAELQPAPVAGHFEPIAPGTPAFAQAMSAIEALARPPGQMTPSR